MHRENVEARMASAFDSPYISTAFWKRGAEIICPNPVPEIAIPTATPRFLEDKKTTINERWTKH